MTEAFKKITQAIENDPVLNEICKLAFQAGAEDAAERLSAEVEEQREQAVNLRAERDAARADRNTLAAEVERLTNLWTDAAAMAITEREEVEALRVANTKLVSALDRIRDVLTGDEYMEHADKGLEQIVNEALATNAAAMKEQPWVT
jgi:maltooligosyltrehalose synthase